MIFSFLGTNQSSSIVLYYMVHALWQEHASGPSFACRSRWQGTHYAIQNPFQVDSKPF